MRFRLSSISIDLLSGLTWLRHLQNIFRCFTQKKRLILLAPHQGPKPNKRRSSSPTTKAQPLSPSPCHASPPSPPPQSIQYAVLEVAVPGQGLIWMATRDSEEAQSIAKRVLNRTPKDHHVEELQPNRQYHNTLVLCWLRLGASIVKSREHAWSCTLKVD